jgi:hypothetical protein
MHGDFQNGWETTYALIFIWQFKHHSEVIARSLQNAIDKCNNGNDQTGSGVTEACPFLTVFSANAANECKQDPAVNEKIDGPLGELPG